MKRCILAVLACILITALSVPAAAATADITQLGACDEQSGEIEQQNAVTDDAAVYEGECLIKADPSLIGEEYTVCEGTRSIKAEAFEDCVKLKCIVIPDTVEHIGRDAFSETALYQDEDNWEDGMLIVEDEYLLKVKEDITECHIPAGVSVVADGAFENCRALKYLVVPPTVETLSAKVFAGITHDTEVYYTGSMERFMENTDMQINELNMTTVETRALLRILFVLAALVSLTIVAFVIRNWHKKMIAIDNEEGYEW